MTQEIFVVNAQIVDANGTFNPLSGYPKAFKPPLLKYAPNDYYEAVKVMQALLNVHRFDSGKADGYFGPKTVAAVNRAKRFWVLECDGTCDKALWEKLLDMQAK